MKLPRRRLLMMMEFWIWETLIASQVQITQTILNSMWTSHQFSFRVPRPQPRTLPLCTVISKSVLKAASSSPIRGLANQRHQLNPTKRGKRVLVIFRQRLLKQFLGASSNSFQTRSEERRVGKE